MNELALFSGAGGGILGGKLLGWRTVCACEIDAHARNALLQRQRDGILPRFPIWDDVKTFDGYRWRGHVQVISGGFPCQDISMGNTDGDGLDGERSGLWAEMCRITGEVQPRYVLVENSPAITFRGLGRLLGDLAGVGYDARWGVLGVENAGGSHARRRFWLVAYSVRERLERRHDTAAETQRQIEDASIQALVQNPSWPDISNPRTYGSNDGLADRVERTKAVGNGQSPAVVRLAWNILGPGKPKRTDLVL